ncbi:UNVERIFIED_CONTAM: hypothetical protein FKN15_078005 [Acipenser sinensis]
MGLEIETCSVDKQHFNTRILHRNQEKQTRGTFDTFVNVMSARTAVGHDKEGWLILFHIDGQTGDRGADDPTWHCPQSISTVLCVHEPQCDPANCSGHGQCVLGDCQCTANWQGAACNLLECEPAGCGSHGMCTASECHVVSF